MKYILLLSVVLFALVSCGGNAPSEREIQTEFELAVELEKDCTEDDECALVVPGCPLGCGVAVSALEQDRIASLGRRLISNYEGSGRGCAYSCIALQAICVESRCEVLEL